MPKDILVTITPRKYQQDIFENCKDKNCLVVLPTGIGKTLIALMLAIHTQKKHPASKTLFLAPTRPLAEQHLSYFKEHLPELFADLTLFTGKIPAQQRKKQWETADIIFSTPQCIGNDLNNQLYSLENVSLLIEDEAHRCLKNYAYRYIAETYREQSPHPHILGLTASPGTERKTIEQIAINLGIETIELRTRESDDVKEYLQELEFTPIRLEFPGEIKSLSAAIRTLYQKKIQELKNRKLLFEQPTKISILKTQTKLMGMIRTGNRNGNVLAGVSATAQALKLVHLIELLETQTLFAATEYMQSLFQQAAKKQSKAVQQLVKTPEFNRVFIQLNELQAQKKEHPKLLQLKDLVKTSIDKNKKDKTIVFTQYRDTAIKIAKELNTIENIKATVFVGQAKKKNSGLSQKEQKAMVENFKMGETNVLVATSIAEEGLDIPEVHAVIFYEPIPSAIRKIQRAGRTARLMKGKLIILITNDTIDEIFYYSSRAKEKRMYREIDKVKKDLDAGIPFEKEHNQKQRQLFS